MKRILSLTVAFLILVLSLAPSASATSATSSNEGFMELLDLCMPDDYDNTKVYIMADGNLRTIFNLREAWDFRYIDVVFTVPAGSRVTGLKVSNKSLPENGDSLTVVNISGDLYRAYGEVNYLTTRLLYFWVEGTCNWVNWESVRVSTNPLIASDENALCDISATDFSATIRYVPTDVINYRYFTGSNVPESNSLNLYINCPNWRKYDYIDFSVGLDVGAVTSIGVTCGDTVVPFDVSYVGNNGSIENHFTVNVRIDIRNIRRDTSDGLILHISGQVNSGSANFISMEGCRGHVVSADFDSNSLWYRRFYTFLQDSYFNIDQFFREVIYYLDPPSSADNNFAANSSEIITDLGGISASMDSVERPSMESIDLGFSADISGATSLMGNLFTEVTSVSWMSTLIMASVTLGLISYILYGKD